MLHPKENNSACTYLYLGETKRLMVGFFFFLCYCQLLLLLLYMYMYKHNYKYIYIAISYILRMNRIDQPLECLSNRAGCAISMQG